MSDSGNIVFFCFVLFSAAVLHLPFHCATVLMTAPTTRTFSILDRGTTTTEAARKVNTSRPKELMAVVSPSFSISSLTGAKKGDDEDESTDSGVTAVEARSNVEESAALDGRCDSVVVHMWDNSCSRSTAKSCVSVVVLAPRCLLGAVVILLT